MTGFGDPKWELNAYGEEIFYEEIRKCEEALISPTEKPAEFRDRRSSAQNTSSADYEIPEASCLDQEMKFNVPCREDPVSGAIKCDCRNLNFCAEDYIILVGNSISMVPLFFSIVIFFSFP